MLTFKNFLEAIQHQEIKPLRSILTKFPDIKDVVRFALFCAEDVYEFNSESKKHLAKKCIDLAKQWLVDPESVDKNELLSAANTAVCTVDTAANAAFTTYAASVDNTINAANAANAAVYVAYAASSDTIYAITYAINAAVCASDANANINGNYEQNMKRYKTIALSYLSKSNIQNKPMMSKVIDKEDYTSILALLDELEESQENIIHQLPDGSLRLNLPKGHDIIGKNKVDLAKKIVLPRNSWIVDWLQRLYDSTR